VHRLLALIAVTAMFSDYAHAQTGQPGSPVTVERSSHPTIGGFLHDGWQVKAFAPGSKPELPSTIILQKGDEAVQCAVLPGEEPPNSGRTGTMKTGSCYQFQ
jgi:hypothetical protein